MTMYLEKCLLKSKIVYLSLKFVANKEIGRLQIYILKCLTRCFDMQISLILIVEQLGCAIFPHILDQTGGQTCMSTYSKKFAQIYGKILVHNSIRINFCLLGPYIEFQSNFVGKFAFFYFSIFHSYL